MHSYVMTGVAASKATIKALYPLVEDVCADVVATPRSARGAKRGGGGGGEMERDRPKKSKRKKATPVSREEELRCVDCGLVATAPTMQQPTAG